MPTVSFDIPRGALSALRRAPDEFAQNMRLAAAMHWYRRGDVSQVDFDELQRELDRPPSS